MPHNWKTYKIEDIAAHMADAPFGSNLKTKDYVEDGVPVVQGKNIQGRTCKWQDNRFVSVEKFESLGRHHAKLGSLVFPKVGTIGKVGLLTPFEDKTKYLLSTNTMMLEVSPKLASKDFVYYYFTNPKVVKSIQAANSNSVQPVFNFGSLKKFGIKLPPLQEQKSIASILSALDDKIELNLQMNKTLEEMAMALYKHWFVDFGPFQDGEFIDSELGKIPKGWEVKKIGEVIETLGGGTPKTNVSEYWDNGNVDWYSPTDLTSSKSLFSIGTAKKITELGLQKSSAKLFPKESLLMSSRATIGAITINRKEASTNQGFITMIPNDKLNLYQLHGWTVQNMDLIISKANGSTFKEISKSNFRDLLIVVAKGKEEYDEKSVNLYNQIENNIIETQTLTQLRDTLLPQLISGKIRVKEAAKTISEVL